MTQEELEKVIESRDKLRKKLEKELKEKKDKKTNIREICILLFQKKKYLW